jgi:hypothetical protein
MALKGNLNFISTQLTGNIVTSSVSVPTDLNPDDQYYEQRGTTVTEYHSESIIVSESMDDAYVKIKNMNLWVNTTSGSDGVGDMMVESDYMVYGSEASRSADISNYVDMKGINLTWDSDLDSDIFSKVYAQLKDELGADTLQDV